MKHLLMSLAGGFLALVLFFIVIPLFLLSLLAGPDDPTPRGPVILTIDLRQQIPDQAPNDGLGALFGATGFVDVLTRLDAAADDPKVKAVLIRANDMAMPSSRAEEMREAILRLRAAGKTVVAHSQGFFMGGPAPYRAISAADEIWLQDGSDFSVSGISVETMFLKGLLDKLGVTAEIDAFKEYKNAPNTYKEEGYTAPHAEALRALAEDFWTVSVADFQADRGDKLKLNGDLRETLENSPYSASQAVAMGLADKLGWPEDAERSVAEANKDAELLDIAAYVPPPVKRGAPVLALISGEGPIVTGTSGGDLLNPSATSVIASDDTAAQIYAAGEDDDVKAIVFRVDSPGGSPIASDQVWKAIEYVRETDKKPVVVSMGTVAASGGYYVSMGADAIVANRTTITGSIGVFGGKLALAEGLRKIGVNPERIDVGGPYTAVFNSVQALDETQRQKMHDMLERTYDRFITLAASGRNMEPEALEAVARGRVWSGQAAADRGLVNKTGGLMQAVAVARELAGVEAGKRVELRRFTPQKSPLDALGEMFASSEADRRALRAVSKVMSDPRIAAAMSDLHALDSGPQQMRMSPIIEN